MIPHVTALRAEDCQIMYGYFRFDRSPFLPISFRGDGDQVFPPRIVTALFL